MRLSAEKVIKEGISDTQKLLKKVRAEFGVLDDTQLQFRPASGGWGVAECFGHMNMTMRLYNKAFDKGIARGLEKGWGFQEEYKTSAFGNLMVRMMELTPENEPRRKMKTFGSMKPDVKNNGLQAVVQEFTDHLDTFSQHLENARKVDCGKVKVPSALGNIIKFRLGDAIRFLTAHNLRHVAQARRVVLSPGFPETSSVSNPG